MFAKSTLLSSALLLLASMRAASAADSNGLWIAAEGDPTQCNSQTFNFGGTPGPFDIEIYTSCSDPSEVPVAVFEGLTTTSVQWPSIHLPVGTQFFVVITDGTNDAYTPDLKVLGGPTSSCTPAANGTVSTSPGSAPPTTGGSTTPLTGSGSDGTGKSTLGSNNAAAGGDAPNNGTTPSSGKASSNSSLAVLASRPLELVAGLVALTLALTY